MALLWIEGFEGYGTSLGALPLSGDVFARKYANLSGSMSSVNLVAGRIAGYAVQGTYNTSAYFRTPVLSTTADTMIAGVGFKPIDAGAGWPVIMRFISPSGLGVNLYYDRSSHEIKVYFGVSTLLGTSSGANISAAGWSYVEMKVKYAYEGTIEVRVGGEVVYTQTSIDTRPGGSGSYYNQVGWDFAGGDTQPPLFDDWYVGDNSGTRNNDFLGDCKVVAVFPNLDAGTNTWTPSTVGDHCALMCENPTNDDTDYLEDSTTDHADLWGYQDLNLSGLLIKGVQINTDIRETDGSSHSLKTECISGGTTSDDTAQTVGITSYVTKCRVVEADPNGPADWMETPFNAAKFGIKVG